MVTKLSHSQKRVVTVRSKKGEGSHRNHGDNKRAQNPKGSIVWADDSCGRDRSQKLFEDNKRERRQ